MISYKPGRTTLTTLKADIGLAKRSQTRMRDVGGLFHKQVDKLLTEDNDAYYVSQQSYEFYVGLLDMDSGHSMASVAQFELMLKFDNQIRDVLMYASCEGNISIVQWVLNANPGYVSTRDEYDLTVLSWAISSDNLALVQWLVNVAGANVMATNKCG